MANFQDQNWSDYRELLSWIVVVIFLATIWPVGVFLLLRKLLRGSHRRNRRYAGGAWWGNAAPGTQGMGRQTPPVGNVSPVRSPRQGKPVNLERGKGMMIAGIVIAAIFGIALVSGLPTVLMTEGLLQGLGLMSPVLGFFGGGLALVWAGAQRSKKAKRFRKYLALIGRRESISITTLAQAMPVSVHKACDDLQDMLDDGILKTGYLDMSTGRLVLSDEGLREEAPAPEPEPEEAEEEPLDMTDDDAVLEAIRKLNDDIEDEEMSRKIDRIGEITGKIFAYQKQNPSRAGQLRSFLSYYLPTTLKILKAYARMEEQGVEGENIRSAKERIEGMMDKVVEGFEKQLDKLFQDDAMDIATDVQVLERMLEKDGLSGGGGMTLGG